MSVNNTTLKGLLTDSNLENLERRERKCPEKITEEEADS